MPLFIYYVKIPYVLYLMYFFMYYLIYMYVFLLNDRIAKYKVPFLLTVIK